MTFVVLAAMAVLVYFFMRAPRRRALAQRQMVSTLLPGEEIVTVGGLLGTVVEVRDEWVLLELSPGTTARVRPGAIGARVATPAPLDGSDQAFHQATPGSDLGDEGGDLALSTQPQERRDTGHQTDVPPVIVDGDDHGAISEEAPGEGLAHRPGSRRATSSREAPDSAVSERAPQRTETPR